MKLKILVKIVEKMLGMADHGDEPRADMYLPDKLLAMALIFLPVGVACAVTVFFKFAPVFVVGAVLGIVLGIFALLCWKNQCIKIISDNEFSYTTMFGNTYTYSFSDIKELRRNQDSLTLFVADKKVHIESMAILSDRLVTLINRSLAKNSKSLKMTFDELLKLPDYDLLGAVWERAEDVFSDKEEFSDGFNALTEEQRIYYLVNYFDMEINNGGLCQFFVNAEPYVVPFLSEYLKTVGADDHKKIYDEFIENHKIDVSDLSSFECTCKEDFQAQYDRYPFDDFDNAFYELTPLEKYLIPFVKENIEKF